MPLSDREIESFADLALTYLTKATGHELTARDATIEFQSLVFSGYTGFLALSGAADGFLYLTASEDFLRRLSLLRLKSRALTDKVYLELMTELIETIGHQVQRRFGPELRVAPPKVFSTEVPNDPIEMPPAVFVLPLVWRGDQAFFVIGLNPPPGPGR